MDGLTNIIDKINEQNDADCTLIIESAEEKAKKILEDAEITLKKSVDEINASYKTRADIINTKAVSGAQLEYKRMVLSEKSRIIESCIEDTLKEMCEAPDDVYFGYFEKLVVLHALSGEGVMKMSQRDIDRLPAGFDKKLCSLLPKDKTLVVSKDSIQCDGGFVIEYPEMRVDCTFRSLIEDKIDEIRDSISSYLFA